VIHFGAETIQHQKINFKLIIHVGEFNSVEKRLKATHNALCVLFELHNNIKNHSEVIQRGDPSKKPSHLSEQKTT